MRPLKATGCPSGWRERNGYSESELHLDRGDLVFAHTDGLIEARREGVMYGAERLSQLVRDWPAPTRPRGSRGRCTRT